MTIGILLLNLVVLIQGVEDLKQNNTADLFRRENLVAWCIVPFDDRKRTPVERAEMMVRLGIKKYAYDYRAEHIPEFDAEMKAIKQKGIELVGWWFPTTLNAEAQQILEVLKRNAVQTQLWVTGGGVAARTPDEQQARIQSEAERIRPIAEAAEKIGCKIGLYNHGGWFGEPENQIAVIDVLKMPNVGIVYNLHHGHDHVGRFPELMAKMLPHLLVVNLNGMVADGDRKNQKIVPLGMGELDQRLLAVVRESGYRGPIGILNHTQENAEYRLLDNLEGLEWLVRRLNGEDPGARPAVRTYRQPELEKAPDPKTQSSLPLGSNVFAKDGVPFDAERLSRLARAAVESGDALRGAAVFARATQACVSCHKLGTHGGSVGPDLTKIGSQQTVEQLAESLLWPRRSVKPEYVAVSVLLATGATTQGYRIREDAVSIVLRDPASGQQTIIAKEATESIRELGSLMPEEFFAAMTEADQRDLVRFLADLGKYERFSLETVESLLSQAHPQGPAAFTYDRQPLDPSQWPSWQNPVNRERIYDFYTKQGRFFRGTCSTPKLLPEFPGLDGGVQGHWGNQSEPSWVDGRWNQTELGSLQCGVFHTPGLTVPRGVCIQLDSEPPIGVCFDPDTATFVASWTRSFLTFSDVRHGFMHGISPAGDQLQKLDLEKRSKVKYRGFYRFGRQVVFAFEQAGNEYLDAMVVKDGKLERLTGPKGQHPLRDLTRGGPTQWPQVLETKGSLGTGTPYAVDTIELPLDNPWKALMFVGDHAFLPDGSALVCTIQGDVWRVEGLKGDWQRFHWRKVASGLNHALGIVTVGEEIYVLGRDQITRLHDLNQDGEMDYYECFSNAYQTSPAGHDFICGLERDGEGRFYTASGNQGLVRISADGQATEVLAFGFRNPDGLALLADGSVTVPSSEGDWVPASMICSVKPVANEESKRFFGHGGPKKSPVIELPMVYLPRGLDNSSGGQTQVDNDRWGVPQGTAVHLSFGAAAAFLLLRDEVRGQVQGGVIPIAGELRSGVHRGKFNPHDGQLYVSGMAGWGTYSTDDGCLQRIRYTGPPSQLPIAFHVHENGVLLEFTEPVDWSTVTHVGNHFAQAWNYRYSGAYGSAEYSTRHVGLRGHDGLPIKGLHVLDDGGLRVFVELPDLQPVNQLHLQIQTSPAQWHDLFLTVHKLDRPFTEFSGYAVQEKVVLPHPLVSDLSRVTNTQRNPYEKPLANARTIELQTAGNLTFAQRQLNAVPGEPLQLTLINTDVVPHNWALLKPGKLATVGELANKLISDPDAAGMQYVPKSADVLAYTDVVDPHSRASIYMKSPEKPGRYPFLCTFPGHWMVMNGELVVKE